MVTRCSRDAHEMRSRIKAKRTLRGSFLHKNLRMSKKSSTFAAAKVLEMLLNILKSKIHRVQVTEANLEYIGSITIDEALMEAANIYAGERVQVVDNNNGARLETYVIMHQRRCSASGERRRHGHHHGLCPHGAGRGASFQTRDCFSSE